MQIIAFGHRKNVGKDQAAKFLINDLRTTIKNVNIIKAGFADKVKSVAYDLYSWAGLRDADFYEDPSNRHLRETKLSKIGKTPREIWIGIGNGLRSSVYDPTWLNYLILKSKCDILVIKDMRFPTEANGILEQGGKVYRIDRPDQPKVTDGADDPLESYDKWTGIIINDEGLDKLHRQVIAISTTMIKEFEDKRRVL